MSNLRLNLVVAACNNNGIGINGKLPWSLRKDMEFFKKITSQTSDSGKQNAVIMGRKTWFSIPEKFRPLKNRINIVLSRELKEVQDGVYVCHSLEEAVNLVSRGTVGETEVENVHVIGGSSVYEESMKSVYSCRIYLTRVLADFECDTFLPALDENTFCKVENPTDLPTTEVQEEKGVKFKFEVYDKKTVPGNMSHQEPIMEADTKGKEELQPIIGANTHGKEELQPFIEADTFGARQCQPIKFNVMAAICSSNRGIGYQGSLPWPTLRNDYEYYCKKTSTMAGQTTDGKLIVHIQGRRSWDGCGDNERNLKNVCRVIVSSTCTHKDILHPSVMAVVPTFDAAVTYCNSPEVKERVDSIWIMGGATVYTKAIHHRLCNRLYMTHINSDFPADVFFPKFEHLFHKISDNEDEIEENGIKYQFKVYTKINPQTEI